MIYYCEIVPINPKADQPVFGSIEFCSHVGLLGELDLTDALTAGNHVLVLDSHNASTPGAAELLVLVELLVEVLGQSLEILEVFLVDFGQGDGGGGLHVHELAKVGLTADEAEWHVLLAAKGGQVDDALNGVDVVGNDDELGLVLLNQGGDVVESVLDVHGLGSLGVLGLSSGLEAELLLLLGLGGVLGEELEELGG